MLPFKLKSFSVLYSEKLEFVFTEYSCIACWASSIFLKENDYQDIQNRSANYDIRHSA